MAELFAYEDPRRRCLKVEAWPKPDRRAWEAALQPGDILEGTVGPGFHWSAQTREKYRKGYGRWLTFLITSGRFDTALSPGERVTPEAVRTYHEALLEQDLGSWTIWGRLAELLATIKVLAPDDDWSWLRRLVRRLESQVVDKRNKLQRLRGTAEILDWALERMDRSGIDLAKHLAPVHYRDALIIALLSQCPLRRANLTMIRIDAHLRRGETAYHLTFAPEETKTRKALGPPIPTLLTPYLDRYREAVRPLLLGDKESDRLWITRYGDPMTDDAVYNAITATTKRAFGVPINPHLFRDCACSFVALNDPKHIGIAAPILGHTDPRTTEKHYIQANQIVAGRRLRSSVDALRDQLRPRPPRHPKES